MDSEKLFLRLANSSTPTTNITYKQSIRLLTLLPCCRSGGCQEIIYSINVYSNLMFRSHIIKHTIQQTGNVRTNVTLKCIHKITVAVENQ